MRNPSYSKKSHSSDFEVHRNWLAITHSLPINQWYTEATSMWTLDYPPLFAWFEWCLSKLASFFDEKMLLISKDAYESTATVVFQRLSVIITELILTVGWYRALVSLCHGFISGARQKIIPFMFVQLFNFGLLLVDHIHFQYNGFLLGILMLSIASIFEGRTIYVGAALFTVLLNMKHLFLYLSPAYFVHIFFNYCLTVAPVRLKFAVLAKVSAIVITISAVSFGPFVWQGQLQNIMKRLFPFDRGLTHAYWAPNLWALYNMADRILSKLLGVSANTGSSTSGLVQNVDHLVLPSISPCVTAALVLGAMSPFLWQCAKSSKSWLSFSSQTFPSSLDMRLSFLKCLIGCAWASFMFGWHVHEKAVIVFLLLLNLLAAVEKSKIGLVFYVTTVGHFSLLPLIIKPLEQTCVVLLLLAFTMCHLLVLDALHSRLRDAHREAAWWIAYPAMVHLLGLLPLYCVSKWLLPWLVPALQFLPLALTSAYCAMGLLAGFIYFSMDMIWDVDRIMRAPRRKAD